MALPSSESDEGGQDRSIKAYWTLLQCHPGWRILWIGEILSNLGNWFSLISTLLVVEKQAGGKGILISIVLVMHFLPSFILFPIAGVFADRYNRVTILAVSELISAASVALLPVVQRPQELWLLYCLLFIEFSTAAFYDPARRALTPSLVPRSKLHLATTLDSFAWSLTGAVGASLGGWAASTIGVQACFFLDAVTYLISAACAYKLKKMQAKDSLGKLAKTETTGIHKQDGTAASRVSAEPRSNSADEAGIATRELLLEAAYQGGQQSSVFSSDGLSNRQSGADPFLLQEAEKQSESAALLGNERGGDEDASSLSKDRETASRIPQGCINLVLWSLREELASLREGCSYVVGHSNRDVLALTLVKASGALIWAAADVLNVEFSELPEMQGLGDAAFTLGLFYASVGFACFVGPIVFNCFTPPKPPNLLLSSALCFVLLMLGYLGMAAAHNIYAMCASIMVRSLGSSTLWVYSTLLLQLRIPDALLGRMMALEMAFLTVAQCASSLFGGVALDDLGLGSRQVGLVMALVAAAVSAAWLPYATSRFRQATRLPAPASA